MEPAWPEDSPPVPVQKSDGIPEQVAERAAPNNSLQPPCLPPETLAMFTARSRGQNSSRRNSGGNSLLYQRVLAEIPSYRQADGGGTLGRLQWGRTGLGALLPYVMCRDAPAPAAHHPCGSSPERTYCLQAELWLALLPLSLCPWLLSQPDLFISCGLFFLSGTGFPASA